MRKLIVTEFLTLDGVYDESTPWRNGYDPDDGQFKYDELFESDALLLGRVTYEGFAKYWRTATGAFAERMNSLPKFVATTTLKSLEWNAVALEGDVVAAVRALKGQHGGHLLTYGSGRFAQTLLKHGLVDELRLMVFPLVLGHGKRLFSNEYSVPLQLEEPRRGRDAIDLSARWFDHVHNPARVRDPRPLEVYRQTFISDGFSSF